MTREHAMRRWFGTFGMICSVAGCAAQGKPPAETEIEPAPRVVAEIAPESAPRATIEDEVVDKILTRLESRQIDDLRSKVIWETGDVVNPAGVLRKSGEIWYRQEKPVPKFKVRFSQKVVAKRATKLDEQHLFDGENYTELNDETKTVIRREIRDPNDKRNPYKVGEGAFPLPFGQRKDDILKEFEVTRLLPTDKDPKNTDHLKLLPRKGTPSAQRYKAVEFWIMQADAEPAGLPVKVRAIERSPVAGEESFIDVNFENVQINSGMGVVPFEIETPEGYQEIFETLDGRTIESSKGKKR